MGKNRKYLNKASSNPPQETHIIDQGVARQLPIIFGFKHLDLNKKPFDCSSGNGEALMYVLKTLRLFSEIIRRELEGSYPKSHSIPDDLVKKHKLEGLALLAPSKKLHQLGRSQTPERIVGYFDSPLNLFQVCFLDLNHNLSGS